MIEKKHAPSGSRRGLPLRSTLAAAAIGLVLVLLGASWAVAETTGLLGERVQQATFASSSKASGHGSKPVGQSQKLRLSYRRSVPSGRDRNRPPAAPQPTEPLPAPATGGTVPAPAAPTPPVEPVDPTPPVEPPPPPPADTTAPQTTISTQPTSPTTATTASIPFTASESNSSFACKLDAAGWASCASPKSYSSLAVGSHTFSVRATDAAGNVDATPATATWSVEAPAPPPPPTGGTRCFSLPSACGYPDATNTGVPAGKTLTSSGSMTLSTNGQVVDSMNITGSVTVTADNVTIRNSKLHTNSGGSGARVITLNNGADNFTLEDSEVYGNGSTTNAPESAVWNHYNNPGARLIRSYLHGSADNWEGRVDLVKDSYMVVDGAYSGSHDENIYVCSTTVNVDHSTLVNEHGQTATVFGDTICGGGNNFTVTDSLLSGGGFIFYPQANNSNPAGAKTVITGNRIARCTTKAVYQAGSGGTTCQGGSDANGYWPLGGYYGVGAYFSGATTWSENVWDDTLAPVAKP